MPTGSLSQNTIIVVGGNIHMIPSGSITTGLSQSAGISQVHVISMSANLNNKHTPPDGTGSYFVVSGSTFQDQQATIVYTKPDAIQRIRVLPTENSSSLGYGSLGGKSWTFTGSQFVGTEVKHRVVYTTYNMSTDNNASSDTESVADDEQTPILTLSSNSITASYNEWTSSADLIIDVPIHVSASALQVAVETKEHLDYSSSYISTAISTSVDFTSSLYGLLITNKAVGFFNKPTGSTFPIFTFDYMESGSRVKVPTNIGVGERIIIPIPVANGFSTAAMISASVLHINGPYDHLGISASYHSPSTFKLTNTFRGIVNAPTHDQARGILTSTSVSGSGFKHQGFIAGTPSTSSAIYSHFVDPLDNKSIILSGSGINKIYMSGSGTKMGFNTEQPEKELDFRADEMQFSRQAEQKGMRLTKNGDLESFNFDAASSSTGSELIMTYQKGGSSVLSVAQASTAIGFATLTGIGASEATTIIDDEFSSSPSGFIATLKPEQQKEVLDIARKLNFFAQAAVGDTVGAIRWAVQSGSGDSDIRGAGEAATIKGIVSAVNDDTGGVTAKLDFAIAKTTGNSATKLFSIDPSVGIVCSSSLVLATGNSLLVGSADTDGVDRLIRYRHATAPFVMGVDDSRNVLAIHSSTGFNNSGTNEFEMTSGGLASFKYSLGVGTVLSVGTNLTVGGYGRIDGLRVGTTNTTPGDGNLYIEDDIVHVGQITASSDISSSGTMIAHSASFDKLTITDVNIVGQRHILWQSGLYINDNPYIVDKGYFGSSIGQTPSNWNDLTDACFDSSAGTFVHQVDITEDQHGSMCFFAPFAISRIEALSSWRTAGTGDDEGFWCGMWTGSAGERLGDTSGANGTTKNIGFLTGSKSIFSNGGNWEGSNNDLDVSVSLPAFTQIYYGHGTTETSGVGAKNTRGHITLMVYEA